MTFTVRHGKIHPFLRTVNHLFRLGPSGYHGELLNNQRVTEITNKKQNLHDFISEPHGDIWAPLGIQKTLQQRATTTTTTPHWVGFNLYKKCNQLAMFFSHQSTYISLKSEAIASSHTQVNQLRFFRQTMFFHGTRPGEQPHFAMERSTTHFSWENPLFLWPFSISMLVHQRVIQAFCGFPNKNVDPASDLRWPCSNRACVPVFFGIDRRW